GSPGGTDGDGSDGGDGHIPTPLELELMRQFCGDQLIICDGESRSRSPEGPGSLPSLPDQVLRLGDPIDVRLADKVHVQVDYLSGGASPLRMARVYHSNAAVNAARMTVPMGTGWHMFYDRSLQVISASQVRLHRANGRTLDFTLSG